MENKVLSIGIAAYNLGKFLPRCLDSLIIPNIDDIEIIIVNNASTDNTSEIAHYYKQRYNNSVIVVDIKENGHYGRAVNAALKVASGKYFKLLDADDSYCLEGLVELVNYLKHSDVDLCVTGYYTINEEDEITGKICVPESLSGQVISSDEIKWGIDTPNLLLSMHSFCIKRQLLINNHFSLQEGIGYVDTEYNYYCLLYSKNIYFLNTIVYRYLVGREGQTISPEASSKNSLSFWKIANKIMHDYLSKRDSLPMIRRDNVLIPISKVSSCFYYAELFIKKTSEIHHQELKELISLSRDCGINLKQYEFHGLKYVSVYEKVGISFHWLYYLYINTKIVFNK